ncbi:ABC transporter substrate-binding protein [Blautia sp.]|uniref:ABC transporter substrate-binding protein n=1 Tax=Blautia sp. TaxID=1955243 RepID=UPI003AB7C4B4
MKNKKMISVLMVGALMAGMLTVTGCGGSSDGDSSAKGGKTELELFSSKAENKDVLQQLVDKFNEAHEDVTIKITAPADAGTVLKTRMAKNDMPDIVMMGGDNNYTEVESAGMLVDLSDQDYISNIQDSYMQMVYDVNKDKEEKAYGVPYATNASGVIYNVDKFEELGLEIPKTWDEFIDVLDQIKDAGEQPLLMTYKDAWTSLCPWNSMAPDLQPDGFTDDRKEGKTTFAGTHEEIVEKYLTLLDYAQDDFMGLTYDDGNKAFANGDAAMIINGNWAINQYKNANADINVNMFALPASNDESKNYVTSGVDVLIGVCKDSANEDMAKEFVSFMMEPENAQTYIDDQFAFSAIKDVEQNNETVAGVKEDIANGKVANFPDHYYPSGFDISALISEMCLNYSNGMDNQENMDQFLKQCDEKYDIANVD